jgi:hypothetical protein
VVTTLFGTDRLEGYCQASWAVDLPCGIKKTANAPSHVSRRYPTDALGKQHCDSRFSCRLVQTRGEYKSNREQSKCFLPTGLLPANIMIYFDNQLGILKSEKSKRPVDTNLPRSAAWVSPHHPTRQSYSEAQRMIALDLVGDKMSVKMAVYKARFPANPRTVRRSWPH